MSEIKMIARNKKASHDYIINEKIEAGLCLLGSEIKSLRLGAANLKESFCRIVNGEVFVYNMNIPIFEQANINNHEPTRARKLLLHRSEIQKLQKQVELKGMTIVPTAIYISNRRAKLEIGVGQGKKAHDKRQSLKQKQANRDIQRELRGRG